MARILNRANRRINAGALDRLEIGPNDAVLEVGFGGGAALARALDRTDGLVAGIEISDAMLGRARRRLRRALAAGRLELKPGGVDASPTQTRRPRANGADIYFWPDAAAGLREIHRVLKPGGRLLVATATKEEMDRRSFTQHGFTKYTERELAELLEAADFAGVAVARDGVRLFTSGHRR